MTMKRRMPAAYATSASSRVMPPRAMPASNSPAAADTISMATSAIEAPTAMFLMNERWPGASSRSISKRSVARLQLEVEIVRPRSRSSRS